MYDYLLFFGYSILNAYIVCLTLKMEKTNKTRKYIKKNCKTFMIGCCNLAKVKVQFQIKFKQPYKQQESGSFIYLLSMEKQNFFWNVKLFFT